MAVADGEVQDHPGAAIDDDAVSPVTEVALAVTAPGGRLVPVTQSKAVAYKAPAISRTGAELSIELSEWREH